MITVLDYLLVRLKELEIKLFLVFPAIIIYLLLVLLIMIKIFNG